MEAAIPTPATTVVIILGASEWPKAPDLASGNAFKESADAIKQYFHDPELFALPREGLLDLFDSPEAPSKIDEEIGSFLDDCNKKLKEQGSAVRDVIVYYVGHGGFAGHNSDYFLAVQSTRSDNPLASGLLVQALAKTLKEKMREQRKYLVLDACFSASAYETFLSAPMQTAEKKLKEAFRKGTALLCSSGPRDPSRLPPGGRYTMFTGALLDVLHEGTGGGMKSLSLLQVGELAKNLIFDKYQDQAVRPQVLTPDQEQGDIAMIPLFPNPAVRKAELPVRLDRLELEFEKIAKEELPSLRASFDEIRERIELLESTSHGTAASINGTHTLISMYGLKGALPYRLTT